MNVTIVDSIMGSGKTEWAIQYMIDNPEKRFIYITPFLDEIEKRIKEKLSKMIYSKVCDKREQNG